MSQSTMEIYRGLIKEGGSVYHNGSRHMRNSYKLMSEGLIQITYLPHSHNLEMRLDLLK